MKAVSCFKMAMLALGAMAVFAFVLVGGWADEGMAGKMSCEMGKSDAGIAWMHGGVGKDARADMEAMAKKEGYTLKVNCAGTNREYLAHVTIVVKDAEGKQMLDVETSGPWLYAKLPEGNFSVTATFKDEAKSFKDVKVGKGLMTLQPRWKLPESKKEM